MQKKKIKLNKLNNFGFVLKASYTISVYELFVTHELGGTKTRFQMIKTMICSLVTETFI